MKKLALQAGRVEINCNGLRHCQQIDNTHLLPGEALVFLNGQQNVGGSPPVGNKDWATQGSFFFALPASWLNTRLESVVIMARTSCVLNLCSNVTTIPLVFQCY